MNPLASVTVCWSAFITTTETAPAACAGAAAVSVVALFTTTPVAAVPPIMTVVPGPKPVPVMVNTVPPAMPPAFGIMLVITGAAAAEYV